MCGRCCQQDATKIKDRRTQRSQDFRSDRDTIYARFRAYEKCRQSFEAKRCWKDYEKLIVTSTPLLLDRIKCGTEKHIRKLYRTLITNYGTADMHTITTKIQDAMKQHGSSLIYIVYNFKIMLVMPTRSLLPCTLHILGALCYFHPIQCPYGTITWFTLYQYILPCFFIAL